MSSTISNDSHEEILDAENAPCKTVNDANGAMKDVSNGNIEDMLCSTEYPIQRMSIDDVILKGSEVFATVSNRKFPGLPISFSVIGKIVGTPSLTGQGTFGQQSYDKVNLVQHRAKFEVRIKWPAGHNISQQTMSLLSHVQTKIIKQFKYDHVATICLLDKKPNQITLRSPVFEQEGYMRTQLHLAVCNLTADQCRVPNLEGFLFIPKSPAHPRFSQLQEDEFGSFTTPINPEYFNSGRLVLARFTMESFQLGGAVGCRGTLTDLVALESTAKIAELALAGQTSQQL